MLQWNGRTGHRHTNAHKQSIEDKLYKVWLEFQWVQGEKKNGGKKGCEGGVEMDGEGKTSAHLTLS